MFPLIRQLAANDVVSPRRRALRQPISTLLREHDQVGLLLERLRELTLDYAVPVDGCASYRALYLALEQLEADTHLHVHLENNRLFPLVLELEGATSGTTTQGER